MASATDDFLSGQGVPVELDDVEDELSRLWGPAAEQAGGPELANPSVTRIVLANLVVFSRRGRGQEPSTYHCEAGRLRPVLDTVAARFPSRTIVLCLGDEPGRGVRAEVSALCHLPAPGQPQVCSERIVLRAGPEAADLLPGAVRPLLEADLPFALWWTDDPRRDEALFRDLGDEATRLILDLPDPGASSGALQLGLDPSVCQFSRDTAWFGITRWREMVASFFDPPCGDDALRRIDHVLIEATVPARRSGTGAGDGPATPRLAVWLAAWLAGQLGWRPGSEPDRRPGFLEASFQGPTGPVRVTIRTQRSAEVEEPQLEAVSLTTRGDTGDGGPEAFRLVRAKRALGKVRIEVDSPSHCSLPRIVLAPELDAARRVAAALESSRNDPPFQNALPHALWLMGEAD